MKQNYYAILAAFLITLSYFILAMHFDHQVSKIQKSVPQQIDSNSKLSPVKAINLAHINKSLLQQVQFPQFHFVRNGSTLKLLSNNSNAHFAISAKDNLDKIDLQMSSIESTLFTTINNYDKQLSKGHLSEIQNYIFQMNSSLTALYIIEQDFDYKTDLDRYKNILIKLDQLIQSFKNCKLPEDFMILLDSLKFSPQLSSLRELIMELKQLKLQ